MGPAGGEAAAELGEGGEVESGVVELEAEGVLPVDAAADGVGGLAIGEVLGELHDGDQGELPGGQCGLSAPGVEVGEVGVAEDGSEFVAEPEVGIPLGEGGAGDAGGQLGDGRDEIGFPRHDGSQSGRRNSGLRHYYHLLPMISIMFPVVTIQRSRCQLEDPGGGNSPPGSAACAGSASAHHAFMNQKIMPRSATRALVTGVGRPARKYQSLPTCVRRPGVSVTLVWSPLARGVFTTAER